MDQGHHLQLRHTFAAAGASVDAGGGDRFPQWSIQETRDFLMIRAELDHTFMETKRNKLLWELISNRLKEMGYTRTPEQCRCKWKNLATRYKGCETMGSEGIRQQFPFYNEMQTIFSARMQRMLWLEAEGGGAASSWKNKAVDEEDENADSVGEKGGAKKKRKMKGAPNLGNSVVDGVREIMEEFMKQQMEMEMQWVRAYEEREERRRVKEMEWRQRMEALENERIMMERRWREKEDQRKIREEAMAEKREALITALFTKLSRHGL